MTRLDRLELVVRNLADRILGEEITFDAIAEQEAAEQGVAYVAPPQEPATDTSALSAIEARLADIEARALVASPPDLPQASLDLRARVEALERRYLEVMQIVQALLQAKADSDQTLDFILDNGIALDGTRSLRKAG
jgi:hypothetical protein